MTREEAYASGQANAHTAPLHDLTGHMARLAIPGHLHGIWMSGLEDTLNDDGFNTEDPDTDGHGWERKALAKAA